MKISHKLILAVLIVLVVATAAWAYGRIYDNATVVSLIPADVRASSYTTNDVATRPYKGQGLLILDAEAQGSGITNIVKIQESKLYSGQTGSTTGDADLDLNLSTSGTPTVAALFTQGTATAQIKYLDLKLKKHGTIASDKTLTAYLFSSATSTPSTVLATSVTTSANAVDSAGYQWVRFTLTTPYELNASTNYWVGLDSTYAASDTNYISWHVATAASSGKAATNDGTWSAVTTKNPLFRIYEYRFADNVTFSTVGNTASFQSKGIEFNGIGGYIRAVSTVAGGSSTGAYSLTLVAPN